MASNTKTKSPPQGFRRGFLLGAGTNPKQKNIQGKTASNTDTAAAKAALLARPASHAPTIQTIADSSLLEVETTLDVNHKNCATDDNFSPWRILAPVGATHATTTRDSKWTQHLPMAARITVLDDDDDDTELDELTDRNDPYHASTTTLRDNPSSNAVRNWNFLIEEEEDERHGPMEQSNGPLWTTAPAAVRELRHDSSTAPQQKLEFGKPVLTDGSTPLGNESHVRERFETPGSDESETRSAPIVRSVTSNGLGPVPVVDADGIVRSHVRGALDRMRCSRKRHWTSIGQTMLLLLNSKNMVPEINNRKDELSILLLLWGCLVDEVVVAVASASGSTSAGTQYFEIRRQQQDPVLWLGLFVLDDCMKRVCSTSPLVRGSNPEGLLWTQIFFVPTETPETMPSSSSSSARSRRLGAINLLDLWLIDDTRFLNLPLADGIIQWNPALTTVILEGLVNHVLPCFINAALLSFSNNPHEVHASSPGKEKSQTILERRRVAVMYRLVAVVATRIRDSLEMDHPVVDKTDNKPSAVTPAISLVGAFWEKVEMMDQVFDAQRDWLLRCCSVPPHLAKGPLDFDWSNLPTNDIRFRCKAAVLADWRHVIKECRELNSEQGTDDKVKEIRWLCDCLIGPRSSLGSFQRSMSLSSGTLKIDDIFSVLESVNEPNTKDQTHADTKDRFLSNHDTTRNCLRGLVGWIAQHCKHLKRLALRDNIRLTMWVLEAKYRSNCGSSVEMVSVIL